MFTSVVKLVREYISREDLGVVVSPKLVGVEEKRANEIMTNTIKFKDGRYEMGLLWKHDDVKLPNNFNEAVDRMHKDEKRIEKLGLTKWKSDLVKGYIEKGYARKATKEDLETNWDRVWYTPQFVTFNQNKIPPKPRNVCDVAAKTKGVSLNSCLLKGPDNLSPLPRSLMHLRKNPVAFTADVKEMFHQIRIREGDEQCQRFLFRDGDTDLDPKLAIYIFQAMMFGPTCSPSMSQFVKNHHAEKFREKFPKAYEVITKYTYVDDSSDSQPTVEDALESALGCIQIYKEGGFDLVGFQSNSLELLKRLPQENVKQDIVDCDFDSEADHITKILGLHWSTKSDEFLFKLRTDENLKKLLNDDVTKRMLLSLVMKIFDPLGFLQLITIRGRHLIQDIWKKGATWDEQVDEEVRRAWQEFYEELKSIENVRIPRQFAPIIPENYRKELIVFVDASDKVYAAVCYLRFSQEDDIHVSLVAAKARVRGMKYKSIPKMELDAAIVGVRLGKSADDWLDNFDIDDFIFLSDSKTVLSWISSTTCKFTTYVEPRIAEILDSTTVSQWSHVPSKENVADDATKWSGVRKFDSDSRWFKGPHWLQSNIEDWPITPAARYENNFSQPDEFHVFAHAFKQNSDEFQAVDDVELVSTDLWIDFLRKVATNTKKSEDGQQATIDPADVEKAKILVFRKIQFDSYSKVLIPLKALYKKRDAEKMSKEVFKDKYNDIVGNLIPLTPFVDDNGVMRKFTRSVMASLPYDMKFPVILDNKHPLTEFLVACFHRQNFHCMDDTVLGDLNEICSIQSARSCLNRVKKKCEDCLRFKAMPKKPYMGELHPSRYDFESLPFTHVGIDAFGPFQTRFKRGTDKKWGLIFTCLTYRAVHIEMIDSMSIEDCMLAIRNFLAAHGSVSKNFYSDNGTNLRGSNRVMVQDFIEMQQKLGEEVAKKKNIKWEFIPAYSPWMGGAWERLIGSVKKCIEFALRDEVHDARVLRTTFNEIAGLLNRRPLTHVPADPTDGRPFTPNSVLIGDYEDDLDFCAFVSKTTDSNSQHLYRRAEHLSKKCMRRFVREYLPEIAKREKWYVDREVKVGDECIMFEKDVERRLWKKAVVTKLHPGKDGIVRVVDIVIPAHEKVDEKGFMKMEKPKCLTYRAVGNLIFTGVNREL